MKEDYWKLHQVKNLWYNKNIITKQWKINTFRKQILVCKNKMQIIYQTYNPLVSNSPVKEIFLKKNLLNPKGQDTSDNSHWQLALSVSPWVSLTVSSKTVFQSFPRTYAYYFYFCVLPIFLIFFIDSFLTHFIDLLISEANAQTVRHGCGGLSSLRLTEWASTSLQNRNFPNLNMKYRRNPNMS